MCNAYHVDCIRGGGGSTEYARLPWSHVRGEIRGSMQQ